MAEETVAPTVNIQHCHQSEAGGLKETAGKERLDLLDWPALELVIQVMTMGAAKYGDFNWHKLAGDKLAVQNLCWATIRHLKRLWLHGEELDQESGLPHSAHAMANCMMICGLLRLASTAEKKAPPCDHYWVFIGQSNRSRCANCWATRENGSAVEASTK